MAKGYFLTGLDIGTNSIKGLVVLKKPEISELEVISKAEVPSFGVRRGVVFDVNTVSKKIKEVKKQLQEETGQPIDSVYVNIGGSHIFAVTSRGSVAVSRADQKISQEDIERAIQAAQAISLPPNKEIIEVFPKEFIVDDERGLKEVLGMKGTRLEVEILALCVFSPYLKNLTDSVSEAEVQILDIFPSPIASSQAVLTPQQKELGVAVVEIGSGTTGLAVYEEGELIHTAIFPIGSGHITNDIAIGFRTDTKIAEKIKKEFGTCFSVKSRRTEKLNLPHQPPLIFSHRMLRKIIEARVGEIFGQVNKELKKISRQGLLPAGIVLTGGGAKLPGIVEFAKKELKLPVRIGFPQKFIGLKDDPALSTVCGLILEGLNSKTESGGIKEGIVSKIKRFFRIFIP